MADLSKRAKKNGRGHGVSENHLANPGKKDLIVFLLYSYSLCSTDRRQTHGPFSKLASARLLSAEHVAESLKERKREREREREREELGPNLEFQGHAVFDKCCPALDDAFQRNVQYE